MAGKKILVVTTEPPDERVRARLREEIPEGAGGQHRRARDRRLRARLADERRGRCANRGFTRRAEQTAEAIEDEARVEVDRTSQNTDAAENVRDALRQFPADEIVVVSNGADDAGWLEEEAVREALAAPGVPVRRLDA